MRPSRQRRYGDRVTDSTATASRPLPGDLDVRWHAGWPSAKHDPAPEIQTHAYDADTIILRQNKSTHYEAPFLFLLLGRERALLVDTGATAQAAYFPLRQVVDAAVDDRRTRTATAAYPLVVAHTHGHGDHVAGDGQFLDRADTTVVGAARDDVVAYFGIADWPHGRGAMDLGGRVVDVIPGPGHHAAAIALYDRSTGLLLTGDTLYRGRLYVEDWPAFVATVERLVDFCATRPVTHVLGCHIEMTREPGRDYPIRTTYQPDEPPLQMGVEHLHALRRAVAGIDRPGVYPFADFVVHRFG